VIFASRAVDAAELERVTGWHLEDRGLCQGDVCVAFRRVDGPLAIDDVGRALGMPVVEDASSGLVALGPRSGGRALTSAVAADLTLPGLDGRPFALSSLRGWKVVLVAWAPW
jgi:hypothetical protein